MLNRILPWYSFFNYLEDALDAVPASKELSEFGLFMSEWVSHLGVFCT